MDSFDKIYKDICKKCNGEKVCERCCAAHNNLESEIAKIKHDCCFADEAKKICGCVKKILNKNQ